MAGFFQNVARAISDAAEQGEEVAKHVVRQVLQHPEVIALGPIGLAYDAAQNLGRGRGLFGDGGPTGHPPIPASLGGTGKLAGLLHSAQRVGKTVAGTQPYAVTSYFGLASASAIVKNTDIADMFATANCTAFTQADTFPWPFQSYRMRWTYSAPAGLAVTSAVGTAAQVTDPAWAGTLHAVFSNATEIARVALNNLGLRMNFSGQYFVSTIAATSGEIIDAQPGVLWPVYYEKNGAYVMSVRSDHAIGTTQAACQISCQLDGWVINDPTILDADSSQVQATIDRLMQENATVVSLASK